MHTTQKRKVLIIGGAGYIGSATARKFCDAGDDVVVFDNLSNGREEYVDHRATLVVGDVLKMEELERVFQEHSPAIVVHLAALKAVGESEEKPEEYLNNNVVGTMNVLNNAARHNVQHIVFSSTAAVYESTDEGVYDEDSALNASSVYGTSKKLSEHLIKEFYRTGRIPRYTIFRYFNIAGDVGIRVQEKRPQNLFPLLTLAIQDGKTAKVFGNDYQTRDGTCIRDYIHVSDIVDAHVSAVDKEVSGIYNLGNGTGYSVLEIINAFENVLGRPVPYDIEGRRAGDPAVGIANPSRAQATLGWKAHRSLDEMVQSTLDVYGIK